MGEPVHAGPSAPPARRADTDPQLVGFWLHGRPATTRTADRGDVDRFLAAAGTPLGEVALGDLQAFADALADLGPTTRACRPSAVVLLANDAATRGRAG